MAETITVPLTLASATPHPFTQIELMNIMIPETGATHGCAEDH